MRHLPSSSQAATPQAARSCCPGSPSAGSSLVRFFFTAPRTAREGCATALARKRHQTLSEGKGQLGVPLGCALLGKRQPRTQRPRLRLTACATLTPHDAAGASSAYLACCTLCPGPTCRHRTHPPLETSQARPAPPATLQRPCDACASTAPHEAPTA